MSACPAEHLPGRTLAKHGRDFSPSPAVYGEQGTKQCRPGREQNEGYDDLKGAGF